MFFFYSCELLFEIVYTNDRKSECNEFTSPVLEFSDRWLLDCIVIV
jgi:hypothetical protein